MEMTQNGYALVIGVDVSKAKLDLAKGSQANPETIANDRVSIKTMIAALVTEPTQTLVVVEATGGYERVARRVASGCIDCRCSGQSAPCERLR